VSFLQSDGRRIKSESQEGTEGPVSIFFPPGLTCAESHISGRGSVKKLPAERNSSAEAIPGGKAEVQQIRKLQTCHLAESLHCLHASGKKEVFGPLVLKQVVFSPPRGNGFAFPLPTFTRSSIPEMTATCPSGTVALHCQVSQHLLLNRGHLLGARALAVCGSCDPSEGGSKGPAVRTRCRKPGPERHRHQADFLIR